MYLLMLILLTVLAITTTSDIAPCVKIHIISARQSNSWPGEGRMGELSAAIIQKVPNADSEALDYPAYGDLWRYRGSVLAGDTAMVHAISAYIFRCPDSKIVLLGYSQGAHIIGDTLCGSIVELGFAQSAPINDTLGSKIIAAVSMGDPSFFAGLSYNNGTNKVNSGWFARRNNTVCAKYDAARVSYCDVGDKFCASGYRFWVHRKYMWRYKDVALQFVLARINGSKAG
ncbi:acetylxylan esterase precursor [Aspergillus avenaceus]|uniref:Acetylxylan esterase n=1 Tax=Aspergillus avenaceus TaxID=36643 RepID=A0A5N6U541_ASPAV|nr:acetylxylan esterase precursor [Aspergillus avenaceus]